MAANPRLTNKTVAPFFNPLNLMMWTASPQRQPDLWLDCHSERAISELATFVLNFCHVIMVNHICGGIGPLLML